MSTSMKSLTWIQGGQRHTRAHGAPPGRRYTAGSVPLGPQRTGVDGTAGHSEAVIVHILAAVAHIHMLPAARSHVFVLFSLQCFVTFVKIPREKNHCRYC